MHVYNHLPPSKKLFSGQQVDNTKLYREKLFCEILQYKRSNETFLFIGREKKIDVGEKRKREI